MKPPALQRIVVATANPGKLAEISALLAPRGVMFVATNFRTLPAARFIELVRKNRSGRKLLLHIENNQPSNTHPFHSFQISGDAFAGHVPIKPKVINPGTSGRRRLEKVTA